MEKTRVDWQGACKILGCKKSHFYNLVNMGILPSERSGLVRGVRVYVEDCKEYLRRKDEE